MLSVRPMELRELTRADWGEVIVLNQASVRELSELDEEGLAWMLSLAHRGLGVTIDHELSGFALAIAPDTAYDSLNYRWFGAHYERFLYLDRVAVRASARRRGVAGLLYNAMEAAARPLERMVCEVNVLPANPASLAFHAARGYVEIDRLVHSQEKVVALLAKELTRAG
jgi:uncharacterized protein